jgi:hypothetical protein
MLLKFYEPEAIYSKLPNTGKELVKIDGLDWQPNETENSKKNASSNSARDGKYFHFGLESAVSGEFLDIIYRDADLFEFVNVNVDDPHLLPNEIVKRVRFIVFPKKILLLIQLISYYCQIEHLKHFLQQT